MQYVVNDDGEMMKQDVDLSFENKYIQINTAPLDGMTFATIIHDTTEVKFDIFWISYCNLELLHIL